MPPRRNPTRPRRFSEKGGRDGKLKERHRQTPFLNPRHFAALNCPCHNTCGRLLCLSLPVADRLNDRRDRILQALAGGINLYIGSRSIQRLPLSQQSLNLG